MPSLLQPSWRAPWRTWLQPAHSRDRHAEIPTAHGTYTLFREPGPRLSADAKAEAWERWQFLLGGETVLEIDDAALPGYGIRRRLRHGVHGRLDGVPFTARTTGRSLLPGRRGVRFTLDDGRNLSFTARPLHLRLARDTGGEDEVLARSRASGWETHRLDRGELALLCFVTLSGADQLLRSPLQQIL
ncbi:MULTISPECIES: hypothetical protein [unclassified Streptomyces]|uniref:hypothetical protein n=1 Tax=unclassified Streptomyces TaxID=2593676 RepID=UPI002E13FD0E|nr:hypothetical protein OG457_26935 [Streptomyces sp. NBC_01207]WTA20396.1 hypothetical protein OG365_21390 [Streptomyces sp. NBC_00853]